MGKEIPTALSVMVYSLLKESTLVPAEGPKLSVKGTSPADMDTGRSRSQPLCHLLVDLPCSLQCAFDFEQVSRPCLHLRPWFLTLDWIMIQALL